MTERGLNMNIARVTLCANQLKKMKKFYSEVLGFEVEKESSDELTLKIGSSKLSFKPCSVNKTPVYHFAFTIPGNLFKSAKEWIQSKVPLNTEEGDDEVYFEFLHSRSFYFYDSAGNVVEFIGRNSCISDKEAFSIDDVMNISEINLTVNDVLVEGKKLLNQGFKPLDNKSLNEKGLNFMGDFQGYFLLGPVNRTWFFSNKVSGAFPVTVELS
jgi:catechol-2,3-dioxygenase